jgi:hypothetical protein
MTWGENQTNFASATGLIYFRPYYIPQSGNWSSLQCNSSSVLWANQTGPHYGPNSGVYFVPTGTAGNCGYMYIYGVGWNNIQFMAYSPQVQVVSKQHLHWNTYAVVMATEVIKFQMQPIYYNNDITKNLYYQKII